MHAVSTNQIGDILHFNDNDIKLMEGQVQTISKDEILEVIGKGKHFPY